MGANFFTRASRTMNNSRTFLWENAMPISWEAVNAQQELDRKERRHRDIRYFILGAIASTLADIMILAAIYLS
jgi:hypothetical protein